jgi:hypothetical protein
MQGERWTCKSRGMARNPAKPSAKSSLPFRHLQLLSHLVPVQIQHNNDTSILIHEVTSPSISEALVGATHLLSASSAARSSKRHVYTRFLSTVQYSTVHDDSHGPFDRPLSSTIVVVGDVHAVVDAQPARCNPTRNRQTCHTCN